MRTLNPTALLQSATACLCLPLSATVCFSLLQSATVGYSRPYSKKNSCFLWASLGLQNNHQGNRQLVNCLSEFLAVQAYVEFATEETAARAMQLHREPMGSVSSHAGIDGKEEGRLSLHAAQACTLN